MDKERILSLLDLLQQYHRQLTTHLPQNIKSYSLEKKRFCERTLQLLIEVCIDISQIIIKELQLGLPEEEDSIFDKLQEAEVISEEMCLLLKDMKKFRNVLIHHYVKIDDALVYHHAKNQNDDFLKFSKEIKSFLKTSKL